VRKLPIPRFKMFTTTPLGYCMLCGGRLNWLTCSPNYVNGLLLGHRHSARRRCHEFGAYG
jgi:hypothetical protein